MAMIISAVLAVGTTVYKGVSDQQAKSKEQAFANAEKTNDMNQQLLAMQFGSGNQMGQTPMAGPPANDAAAYGYPPQGQGGGFPQMGMG